MCESCVHMRIRCAARARPWLFTGKGHPPKNNILRAIRTELTVISHGWQGPSRKQPPKKETLLAILVSSGTWRMSTNMCVCVCAYVCVCAFVLLSLFVVSRCLSLCLSLLSVSLSACLSLLSVSLVCLCVYLPIFLSVSTCLSVYLCVRLYFLSLRAPCR